MMPRSRVELYVHYIWSTKRREPLLRPGTIHAMRQELFRVAEEKGFWIRAFNGVSDHVHALVSLKSTHTVAWAAQQLKGISSRWCNEQGLIPGGLDWQDGYGAFSVSRWDLPHIEAYIRRQPEHHQDTNFETEWKLLEEGWSPPKA
jgi:REP element-mobilizing transposase RayT